MKIEFELPGPLPEADEHETRHYYGFVFESYESILERTAFDFYLSLMELIKATPEDRNAQTQKAQSIIAKMDSLLYVLLPLLESVGKYLSPNLEMTAWENKPAKMSADLAEILKETEESHEHEQREDQGMD